MSQTLRLSLLIDGQTREAVVGVNQLGEALSRLEGKAGQAGRALRGSGAAAADATKLTGQELAQMQFQLQDIAVGLTSGQSPFTVMMQQGSQLAQSFRSGTGVLGALRQVGQGLTQFLTNPLNLAVAGFGLAASAATSLFDAVAAESGGAEQALARHEDLVKRIKDAYDGSTQSLKAFSAETRRLLLFDAMKDQADLGARLRGQLSGLITAGRGRITAIGDVNLEGAPGRVAAPGERQIAALVAAFREEIRKGEADVKSFADRIAAIGIAAGPGSAAGQMAARIIDATRDLVDLNIRYDESSRLVKSLSGNMAALGHVLGETSAKTAQASTFGPFSPYAGMTRLQPDRSGLSYVPQDLRALFVGAAEKFSVSAGLLARIAQTESGFNPDALSPKGAQGIMQLMPGTARDMGVDDPFNANQSIFGGARYIRELLDRFAGDVEKALLAYNWGPGNVTSWIDRGSDPAQVPEESRSYVARVMAPEPSIAQFVKADDKADAAAQERWAEAVARSASEAQTLAAAIGLNAAETARLRKEQDLWAEAGRHFGDRLKTEPELHRRVAAEIAAAGEAAASAAAKREHHARVLKLEAVNAEEAAEAQAALIEQFRGIGSGLVQAIAEAREAGDSWMQSFAAGLGLLEQKAISILDRIIDKLLDMALVGDSGSGGLLGGLLGRLLGGAFLNPMQNALGNAFSGGRVIPFALGGVVSSPALFPLRGGTGLMGEAGPEAIMPLARLPSGHLGVRSAGGGERLTVNTTVHNYSGGEVATRASETAGGGIDLEVIVGQAVNRHLAQGGADGVLAGRFGLAQRTGRWG